jgi:hypothetical protein
VESGEFLSVSKVRRFASYGRLSRRYRLFLRPSGLSLLACGRLSRAYAATGVSGLPGTGQ